MTNLDERIRSMAIGPARPARTLGEALKSLPFPAPFGIPRLEVGTLLDDKLPELDIPGVADEHTKAGNRPSKETMRSMTWIPIPLDRGETIAHLVLPAGLTSAELETIAEVIRKLVPSVARAEPPPPCQAEPQPATSLIQSELELEHRAVVDTATAANYLNRKPQTLRIWASQENGPISPRRVNGRLAWSVIELRRCLGLVD